MFSELLRNQRAEASGAPASLVPRHDGDTRGSRRRQWIEHEAAAMASSRLPSEGPQDTKPYRRLRGPPRTSPQPTQTHRWNVDDARRAAGDGRECRRCPSAEPGSLHRRRHGIECRTSPENSMCLMSEPWSMRQSAVLFTAYHLLIICVVVCLASWLVVVPSS
jgi:hypothetical protein